MLALAEALFRVLLRPNRNIFKVAGTLKDRATVQLCRRLVAVQSLNQIRTWFYTCFAQLLNTMGGNNTHIIIQEYTVQINIDVDVNYTLL